MKIIANAGQATSTATESFKLSREGKYSEAQKLLTEANKYIGEAVKEHLAVVKLERTGLQLEFNLLFMHAEAQLTSAQTVILLANELVNVYRSINKD